MKNLMYKITVLLLASPLLLGYSGVSNASLINYSASNLGGNLWQYDYTLVNDGSLTSIDDFTVIFDIGSYSNLALVASSPPADWAESIVQPGSFTGINDGWYDAFTTTNGVQSGESLGLFSVQFNWLLSGLPGAQPFTINNPQGIDLDPLATGTTVLASVVPVPAAIWMFGSGLLALVVAARRRITIA